MRKPLNVLSIFFLLVTQAQSQELKRIIIDLKTKEPVPYATIKVLHTNLGKIASASGEFVVNLRPSDSILITSVGYKDTVLVCKNIGDRIALVSKSKMLESVSVKTRKVIKKFIIGNGADIIEKNIKCNVGNNCMLWSFGSGAEFAEPISLPDSTKTYHLGKVFIPVTKSGCWQPIFLQIYERDSVKEGPGILIFKKLISFQSVEYNKGKLIIDLNEENIFFEKLNNYFISISWGTEDFDQNCLTALVMIKSVKGICFSRNLKNLDYHWFHFDGNSKNQKEIPGRFHTMFAVEIEELHD